MDDGPWTEERKRLAELADIGLRDGDLVPLARYLRAGYQLDWFLTGEIIDAIEGHALSEFHIVTKARGRGERGWSAAQRGLQEKVEIGRYVQERLASAERGAFEAVIMEAAESFMVKRTTVTEALKVVRELDAQHSGS